MSSNEVSQNELTRTRPRTVLVPSSSSPTFTHVRWWGGSGSTPIAEDRDART